MNTITKKDLAKTIAESQDLSPKKAADIISALFEEIIKDLSAGDTVDINGFGKFEVKERAARTGINPRTKEKVEIPATKTVKFSAKKALKDAVKGDGSDKEDNSGEE